MIGMVIQDGAPAELMSGLVDHLRMAGVDLKGLKCKGTEGTAPANRLLGRLVERFVKSTVAGAGVAKSRIKPSTGTWELELMLPSPAALAAAKLGNHAFKQRLAQAAASGESHAIAIQADSGDGKCAYAWVHILDAKHPFTVYWAVKQLIAQIRHVEYEAREWIVNEAITITKGA